MNNFSPKREAVSSNEHSRILSAVCNQNYDRIMALRSSAIRISQAFNGESLSNPEDVFSENSCFRSVLKQSAMEIWGVIQNLEFIMGTCLLNSAEAVKTSNEPALDPLDQKTLMDIALIVSNMAHRVSSMVADITIMTFTNRETTHYSRAEKDEAIPSLEIILVETEGDLERAIIGIDAYLESLC